MIYNVASVLCKVVQLYIYPFFFIFFSWVGYYGILSRIPCAIQQVLEAWTVNVSSLTTGKITLRQLALFTFQEQYLLERKKHSQRHPVDNTLLPKPHFWRASCSLTLFSEDGFPDSSVGKESTCNVRDPGSIPGSGRSPGEGIDYPLQYSWASLVAQLVKNPPTMWETWVPSLGWEDPLENGKATLSSILAWKIPWTV